jgi:hypothetical protein
MLLLLKLTLVPLVVTVATLVARRFGTRWGGVVTGLPLTAGPVSVFLAVQHGATFAAHTAVAMILSLVPITAYASTYWLVSSRANWPLALAAGFGAHLSVTALVRDVPGDLTLTALAALCAVAFGLLFVKPKDPLPLGPPPRRAFELPLRIVVATSIVVAITLVAERIGPALAGLLTTMPIIASVVAVTAHAGGGRDQGIIAVRGHLIGTLSLGAFFVVVASLIERLPMLATYALAITTAIGINVLVMRREAGYARPGAIAREES